MKYRIMGATSLTLLLALMIVRPAAAVTVEEVIGLAEAGSSDSVILAKIDSDGTVFHLTVDEILELKEKGVSDVVITYMINTGKAGDSDQVLEPEEETGPPADGEDKGGDGGGDVSVGFGFDSYGNVGFSFGYYYPHWPGYWYSYYYDPFWWPSWCWYGGYWQPYPYYNWYYDPWYGCNTYYHGYYDHCYYGGYYDGYGYEDGRNVGSRGPTGGYDRVIKKPGEAAASRSNMDQARTSTRMKDPGGEKVAQNRSSTGSPNRNAIRTPDSRTSASKVQRPERSRVRTPQYVRGTNRGSNAAYRSRVRTQPGRGQDVAVYRSRPTRGRDGRIERSAPSQGEVASPPSRTQGRSYQNGSRGYQNGGRSQASTSRSYQNGGRSFQGSSRSFQSGGRATPSMGSRGGGGGGGFRGGGGHGGGGSRGGKH